MIKTYFTCDKCNHAWDLKDRPERSVIKCTITDSKYGVEYNALSMEWCQSCLDESKINKPFERQKPEEQKAAPNPTTEDLLIGLLEQLGFVRGQ